MAWQRAWCATAVDHDLAGPSWPREYGGMDLTFEEQVVYAEEAARARVPGVPGTGVGIAGPDHHPPRHRGAEGSASCARCCGPT